MVKSEELDRLKECLDYNQMTGAFTWKVNKSTRARIGQVAGGKPQKNGYLRTRVNGKRYLLHRLAWWFVHGALPENQIDHINGVRTDNRIENLRDVTQCQNMQNASMYITNTSGRTGVYFKHDRNKWMVSIKQNGTRYHLGYYVDFDEACRVRSDAEIELGFHENHGVTHRHTKQDML